MNKLTLRKVKDPRRPPGRWPGGTAAGLPPRRAWTAPGSAPRPRPRSGCGVFCLQEPDTSSALSQRKSTTAFWSPGRLSLLDHTTEHSRGVWRKAQGGTGLRARKTLGYRENSSSSQGHRYGYDGAAIPDVIPYVYTALCASNEGTCKSVNRYSRHALFSISIDRWENLEFVWTTSYFH